MATKSDDVNVNACQPLEGMGDDRFDSDGGWRSVINEGHFVLDRQWRFLALNRVAENYFGKPADELIGKNVWHETDVNLDSDILRKFKKAVEDGHAHHFETQSHIHPGFRSEWHLNPRNENLEVYFRDISKRKQTEQVLKERERFLDTLINAIPIPVFYKDIKGRYTGFNKAFETFFGKPRDSMIGKSVFDLHPPELAAVYHAKDNELFENGGVQQYESQIKNQQGQRFDVQFNKSVYTDSSGKRIGLIGTILDLTERKRMENALQESKARLKALSDASFEAIFLSEKGIVVDQNRTAEKMFGYTREGAVGRHVSKWIAPEDRNEMLKNMHSGHTDPYEMTALRKNGTTFPCEIQSQAIQYRGRDIHVIALRNITARRITMSKLADLNQALTERTELAEQRAAEIQRLALALSSAEDHERKRLSRVLHDDFQQMLAYIKLQLAKPHPSDGKATNLKTAATLIDELIQNCRNLAHELNPHVIERKGFFESLRLLCRQMEEVHGLHITVQTTGEAEIQPIELASILIRCVRELLFNVIKHSGHTHASVHVGIEGNRMTITVEDAGKGCDPCLLEQKKVEGSVFGLFNIEDRLKLLGGQMQVRSQAGKGFCVTIQAPAEICARSSGSPIRILLADDHGLMREGLAKLLNDEADMEVVAIAADGKEAVDMAARTAPDVVVMDVSMPRISGIDATREIKKRSPGTAIIGLSMHANPDIRHAMLDAGAFAYLDKAESANTLAGVVRSIAIRPK